MKQEINMTSGSLWDKILLFALPLAASSILQQLFNSADSIIVGRFSGSDALAAVGANSQIISLMVLLFTCLSIGSNAVISRALGSGNRERASRAVHTSMALALVMGLVFLVLSELLARSMLRLIDTPDNIMDQASLYLHIYLIGLPFIGLYNFEAAILRSKGDTVRPMITLLVAGFINLLLNILFVVGFHMSVAGVALATLISNIISSIALLYFLWKEEGALQFRPKNLCLDGNILKGILQIGIPSAVQGLMYTVANVIIQYGFNQLGSDSVAASTIGLTFEIFTYYGMLGFQNAAVTFIGQNVGAGDLNRCKRATKDVLLLGELCVMTMAALFVVFRYPLAGIFTTNEAVAAMATQRMLIDLSFYEIYVAVELITGCMRGFGYSFVPALISILGVCGVRTIWTFLVFPHRKELMFLCYAYPLSWSATALVLVPAFLVVLHRITINWPSPEKEKTNV